MQAVDSSQFAVGLGRHGAGPLAVCSAAERDLTTGERARAEASSLGMPSPSFIFARRRVSRRPAALVLDMI